MTESTPTPISLSPDDWARLRASIEPDFIAERQVAQNRDGTYVLLQPHVTLEGLAARLDNVVGPGGYRFDVEALPAMSRGDAVAVRCTLWIGAYRRRAIAEGPTYTEAYELACIQAAAHFGIGRAVHEAGPYWAEVDVTVRQREPAAQALLDPGRNDDEGFGPLGDAPASA